MRMETKQEEKRKRLWNWKNPLLGFFAGIISSLFYAFPRFSMFSTFSPFFRDSTALFLRFSRFLETVQHFFYVFFERNWDSATTANPVCPSAARESCSAKQEAIQTEIALLWPTRRSRRQATRVGRTPLEMSVDPFFNTTRTLSLPLKMASC